MADNTTKNAHVVHPRDLKKQPKGVRLFNNKLALKITDGVGTMWTAYTFTIISVVSLPAVLAGVFPHLRSVFPHWLIAAGLIALVGWISSYFLQLVLLPIIIVGQNVIQDQQGAKAEADHQTLTYLANLQEEQMTELKNQSMILEYLKKKTK